MTKQIAKKVELLTKDMDVDQLVEVVIGLEKENNKAKEVNLALIEMINIIYNKITDIAGLDYVMDLYVRLDAMEHA